MRIRAVRADDAAAIARVHVASWQTTYRGIVPDSYLDGLSVADRTARWERILAEPAARGGVVVVEDATGAIVGFASGGTERSGDPLYTGELYAIYLDASQQGRGVGRLLVRAVAGQLAEMGHRAMLVWVLAENPARQFYARLGARPVRSQPIEIGGVEFEEIAYGWDDLRPLLGASGDPRPG